MTLKNSVSCAPCPTATYNFDCLGYFVHCDLVCRTYSVPWPCPHLVCLAFPVFDWIALRVEVSYASLVFCQRSRVFWSDYHRRKAVFEFLNNCFIWQVSAGTLDSAKEILAELIEKCNTPVTDTNDPTIKLVQQKVFPSLCQHLIRDIVSPNETLRKQVKCKTSIVAIT